MSGKDACVIHSNEWRVLRMEKIKQPIQKMILGRWQWRWYNFKCLWVLTKKQTLPADRNKTPLSVELVDTSHENESRWGQITSCHRTRLRGASMWEKAEERNGSKNSKVAQRYLLESHPGRSENSRWNQKRFGSMLELLSCDDTSVSSERHWNSLGDQQCSNQPGTAPFWKWIYTEE